MENTINILAIRERRKGETRTAMTPDSAKLMVNAGANVLVETGVGTLAGFADETFAEVGAGILDNVSDKDELASKLGEAPVILSVHCPARSVWSVLPTKSLIIGMLDPWSDQHNFEAMAKHGITAITMEFLPRISRAQSMDVLSSQASLAGYQAVIAACQKFSRAIPMMMTAAGAVPPAKVFVMGAGVAGLQAIATAKRLGAIVTATDVRPAAKEQVESLGGKFVAVEDDEFKAAETASGYAKEMSSEYRQKQAELVAKHIAKQDIVITTALIPGRPAPKLISSQMLSSMRQGSVVLDMAAERGGNVEGCVVGKTIHVDGITIIGASDLACQIPDSSSRLYARNLSNFLLPLFDKSSGENPCGIDLSGDLELLDAVTLTRGGEVVHPSLLSK